MMNVPKQQFKSFETSAEEISFQIISFSFQLWMFLLLALTEVITQILIMQMMEKAFRSWVTIAVLF